MTKAEEKPLILKANKTLRLLLEDLDKIIVGRDAVNKDIVNQIGAAGGLMQSFLNTVAFENGTITGSEMKHESDIPAE